MIGRRTVLYVLTALFAVVLVGGILALSFWPPAHSAAAPYLSKAESIIADASFRAAPYAHIAEARVAAALPESKDTLKGAVRKAEAFFKAHGLSDDESVNLGTDLVGAVIQAMTLGALLSGIALLVRWFEKRRRRRFLGAQIWSDYLQVLETLKKIHNRFERNTRQGTDYLSFMLIALERQIERLESRSSEFGDIVDVAAREHFDAAVNVLDALFNFTTSARLWNDSAEERAHDDFYVLRDESFIDLNSAMLAFMKGIERAPSRVEREKATADANSLEKVKGAFIGVRQAGPALAVAA